MNCESFKKMISERFGNLYLDEMEKKHLEECSECRQHYEEYGSLEESLKQSEITPLGSVEFAMIQQTLDNNINRYQMKAISFYRLSTHYGAGAFAVLFLFFVSLWSGFQYGVYYTESTQPAESYYLADNEYDESEEYDQQYIELLLNDYTKNNGFNSGDLLLDELTADEMEYLQNNLEVGDIL